ncbi:MAG TPA: hypothetical protein VHY35_01425 [Stellaceae bacterium]|nr:hypothetical protein [Stellaceae bacterium]
MLQVLVSAGTAYTVELVLQAIDDWSHGRRPAFMGNGFNGLVIFLLPAHITGFAISMLLFAHDELLPYVLAATAAITSKAIFTVVVRGKPRHFLNPSNFGLAASILIYPTIGLAAPYEFTEHLYGLLYVVLPAFILYTGSLLNGKLTKRMPLIFTWVGAFIVQATVRHFIFDTRLISSLVPITGVPFIIFTFYMVTDPATSPSSTRGQIVFGASLAAIYGILMAFHQAFTLIVSLMILCVCRGAVLYAFEHGFMPKLRAFLDGQPGLAAPIGARPALATAETRTEADGPLVTSALAPAIPQPLPVHGAE